MPQVYAMILLEARDWYRQYIGCWLYHWSSSAVQQQASEPALQPNFQAHSHLLPSESWLCTGYASQFCSVYGECLTSCNLLVCWASYNRLYMQSWSTAFHLQHTPSSSWSTALLWTWWKELPECSVQQGRPAQLLTAYGSATTLPSSGPLDSWSLPPQGSQPTLMSLGLLRCWSC